MKKTNKKGFTLVELVIVIAVIAILAGVLIATFASVIKKANDSAEVQNIKNAEIAQKADDIIAKIENSNWFGWEDFEASIVAKIAEVVKKDGNNTENPLTATQVETIVKDALATVLANEGNTGLTVEQVKSVVENAIGTLRYEGVTEAQVRAIVKAASNEVTASQLTVAQVKSIVNAANANNLTAADIVVALGSANIATADDITTAVNNVTNAINGATSGLATKAQAEQILEAIEAINVNTASADLDDVITAKALNIRIKNAGLTRANTPYDVVSAIEATDSELKSTILLSIENGQLGFFVIDENRKVVNPCGLTITVNSDQTVPYKYWTFANAVSPYFSTYLKAVPATVAPNGVGLDVGNQTVSAINYTNITGTARNVVIRTNSYSTVLTIDAENDTVTHYGKANKVDITAVDNNNCYNEHGDIAGNINLEKGKVVVHNDCSAGAVVIDMTAAELATVTTLSADNSANKEVPIILNTSEVLWGANPNNGLINPTTNNIIYSSTGGTLPENFNTMTNEQKEAAIADASNNLIQGVAAIKNTGYPTLQAAIDAAQDGDVIVLLADIALESSEKVTVNKTITLNMNEKTITGSAQELVQVGSSTTIGHLTIRGNGSISSSAGNMLTVNPNSTLDIYDGNYEGLTRTFNVLGGKVTTYGGSFSTTKENQDSLAYLENAGYCNFLGGTFTTPTNGNYGICIKDASVVNLGAKGEAGPSFSTWRPCIATNGMFSHAATININSGTYKSNRNNGTPDDQSVIQLANDSNQTQTLNVYGGYFEQTSAPNGSVFHVRYRGTININISGGSFKHLGSSLFTGLYKDDNSGGWPTVANIRVNVTNNAIAGKQKVLMYGKWGGSTVITRLPDLDFDVNP